MPNILPLITIGRAEKINITGLINGAVPAKVDTGADMSSIWASDIKIVGDSLYFKLFDPASKFYTGEDITLEASNYRLTRISNSFGQRELRYVVKLPIVLLGRKVRATFSLSDRSGKLYPILLGRRLLKGKYIVDVSKGDPLHDEEKKKRIRMYNELKNIDK